MKKPTILILHGWGASAKSFQEVKALFEKEGFDVDVPDLPGFGSEPLSKSPMSFDDYVDFVKKLIGDQKVILLGHSFGGRIAIALAAQNPSQVTKLILTGASGIPHPLSVTKQFGNKLAKVGKIIFSVPGLSYFEEGLRRLNYMLLGEWDYYTVGGLKETFKNVYKVDIRDRLSKITSPTLLIWGENDYIIPVTDSIYMQEHIKDAQSIIVKGATHKLPYEMPHVFIEKILPFLKQ